MASHQADPGAAQQAAAEVEAAAEALVGIWAHVAESLDVRISPTQLRALTAVGRYGELNLSQLAETLGGLPSLPGPASRRRGARCGRRPAACATGWKPPVCSPGTPGEPAAARSACG